ncbi:tripartite tricarboxylate transporter substrate-binding protein [Roseomonas sp. GC11]|uniref:tripartite tricarboxylate transporter substrate-binding protein n=1 Tax=Roseomonas sp. GC11 TaxID=2950546 RepID=UPI002109F3F2|nr:tripartite tricarboxylate transporter substrate-binding protein [Roseomonas sp. GC11]MCQ4160035.1 tripartite tricarboxylate transporter substrate-binding protein [Roseomonas sp. GC11]
MDEAFRRRAVLGGMAGGMAALVAPLAAPRGARAQGAAPVLDQVARTIVGFPAGGSSDTVARLYAERLRGAYAPQVIVENRPGAGGRVGIEAVKAARPDGATLLQTPASMLTIYPHIYPRSVRYDALADFIPVTPVCSFPFGFAVRADHPARSLAEFAAWARAQGNAVPFASPAAGSMPHFLGVQMAKALGLSLTHVPYRGSAPAMQDLIGGQIPAVMLVLGDITEYQRTGHVRILGISAPQRLPRLPELPTFAEQGYPALTAEEWFGVLLPARTPAPVVAGLHRALLAAAAQPELQQALARLEYSTAPREPAAFAAQIAEERQRWGGIIADSGFQPED